MYTAVVTINRYFSIVYFFFKCICDFFVSVWYETLILGIMKWYLGIENDLMSHNNQIWLDLYTETGDF